MKKIYFLGLLFFSILATSQIKSGIIEYSLTIGDNKDLDAGEMKEYYSDAKKSAKYLTYNLEFNESEMIFYQNPIMNSEGNDTAFAVAFSGVDGKYYKEKKSNVILNEKDNRFLGKVVLKTDEKIEWTLLKETKKIQNYLCYKATTVVKVKNRAGEFSRKIIVWYCPKLPVSFGPKGFGGLPGLILEFQDRNVVLGAKKIKLKNSSSVIKKDFKGKVLTEAEFNKMLNESIMKEKE